MQGSATLGNNDVSDEEEEDYEDGLSDEEEDDDDVIDEKSEEEVWDSKDEAEWLKKIAGRSSDEHEGLTVV